MVPGELEMGDLEVERLVARAGVVGEQQVWLALDDQLEQAVREASMQV